jgi:hypothetical protein
LLQAELQLKAGSLREQEQLDKEAEDVTTLEAVIKQCTEDRGRKHYSVCDSEL